MSFSVPTEVPSLVKHKSTTKGKCDLDLWSRIRGVTSPRSAFQDNYSGTYETVLKSTRTNE
eukprot:938740-Amphidinium_carterae.1